ncbi:hypothetical protein [Rhodococcus zopfii]|uniref:hypothetical protein n=1 Tax=Rhodococcus zopfii TaxID=43772 RepID=UPI0035284130
MSNTNHSGTPAEAPQLTSSTTGAQPADARFSAGIAAFFRSSRESRIAQQHTPHTP